MIGLLLLLWWSSPVLAEGFLCAGSQGASTEETLPPGVAGKPARISQSGTTGTRRALVLFARFKEEPANPVPAWAGDLFNPDLPGSFSHFYDTMSFGRLQVRGEVAPRVYESAQPASAYLENDQTPEEDFGRFSLEILCQADQDIDFTQFDNDGPDGIPNSGDDDGVVDAVFLVLDKIPAGFLLGEATGIKGLGFEESLVTADVGKSGHAIKVLPGQGTIQQGHYFAEAVGSMCHEYGHVLGLPDLYNTDFLAKAGAGPEEDSGGVGAWCLMGWGAMGWSGNDGPNSFCAWSREQLGWAAVQEVAAESQEFRLGEVGKSGELGRVLLTGRESFLLEYRTRTSSYYDRNIPGEGLLVWHAGTRRVENALASQVVVDLECADGRWQDAGYPLGKVPDPQAGEDNLDFWAHDEAYTRAHGGNLGDATDPFDGVRFTSFTPETNPASYNLAGSLSARIEGIHRVGNTMVARVQTAPLIVAIKNPSIKDEDGDGIALAGERLRVNLTLTNTGGLPAQQVKVLLRSDDPWVEILQPETAFADLKPGQSSFGAPAEGFPVLRVRSGFVGVHRITLALETYAGEIPVGQVELALSGVSPRQEVQEVAVIDSLGNGDGVVQNGEFIRLQVGLAQVEDPAPLRYFSFWMRSLDPRVRSTGITQMLLAENTSVRKGSSPEFLVPTGLDPGSHLQFELEVRSPFESWKDTVEVEVFPGPDQTPPRVLGLQTLPVAGGVHLALPASQVLEGGQVRRAEVVIYNLSDTTEVARVPLAWQGIAYGGSWHTTQEGIFLAAAIVEDEAGNQGRSKLHGFFVQSEGGIEPPALASAWEEVPLPHEEHRPVVDGLLLAPGNPEVLYANTSQGAWRSVDGGASWERLSLMRTGPIHIDALDPFTLYTSTWTGRILRSHDGGMRWQALEAEVYPLAADPVLPGRLYGNDLGALGSRRLIISEDYGQTWRETPVDSAGFLAVNPAYPQYLYSGQPSNFSVNEKGFVQFLPGFLWRSADGGQTWEKQRLGHAFDLVQVDPRSARGLYASGRDTLWHSGDGGAIWETVKILGSSYYNIRQRVHPADPLQLFITSDTYPGEYFFRRSRDAGQTWEEVAVPEMVSSIILHPYDPNQYYVLTSGRTRNALFRSADGGAHWEEVQLPQMNPSIGTVVFDVRGQLYAGATRKQTIQGVGNILPGFYFSPGEGQDWRWQGDELIQNQGIVYYSDPPPLDVLQVDPQQPEILLASVSGALFARSTDGGRNWKTIENMSGYSGPGYTPIIADPRHAGVYYLASQTVWRSADYGETWEERAAGINSGGIGGFLGFRVTGLALDAHEEQTVLYASTYSDSLWRSEDEGRHWTYAGKVREGEIVYTLGLNPLSGRLYAQTSGGFYVSGDLGQTWTLLLPVDPRTLGRIRLRFDPHDPERMFLVTGPKLLETRDGGPHWRSLGEDLASVPWFNDVAIDPLDPEVIYAATPWGVHRLNEREGITAVEDDQIRPAIFALDPNYPNPFNPSTTIHFNLPQPGEAELAIYNLLGQRVAVLVKGVQETGPHVLQWNGRDGAGRELASGVYFYRLQAGTQVETHKLLLLR